MYVYLLSRVGGALFGTCLLYVIPRQGGIVDWALSHKIIHIKLIPGLFCERQLGTQNTGACHYYEHAFNEQLLAIQEIFGDQIRI